MSLRTIALVVEDRILVVREAASVRAGLCTNNAAHQRRWQLVDCCSEFHRLLLLRTTNFGRGLKRQRPPSICSGARLRMYTARRQYNTSQTKSERVCVRVCV